MRFKILGINSDADFCSICGKQDLSRVVWIDWCDPDGNPNGYPQPVGSVCAGKLRRQQAHDIEAEARQAEARRRFEAGQAVQQIDDEPAQWIIEETGQLFPERIGTAQGSRPAVEQWAAKRWPGRPLAVRPA
jgi:hypothetical protein